jgi:hypothetical protein
MKKIRTIVAALIFTAVCIFGEPLYHSYMRVFGTNSEFSGFGLFCFLFLLGILSLFTVIIDIADDM